MKRFLSLRFVLASIVAAVCCIAIAQDQPEYSVKAQYIYNFSKFVEFPSETVGNKFVIGVLGVNPFEDDLESQYNGKLIGGKQVVIKHLDSAEEAGYCNVVYISPSEDQSIKTILTEIKGRSILTIGDTPGYASRGVMINMILVDGRIRFEVNLACARNSHLAISSRLLSFAKGVIQ